MQTLLFGNTWMNSRNEEDHWGFYLNGDLVHLSFSMLFDADTFEYSYGNADFSKDGFVKLLKEFCEKGASQLHENGASVSLARRGPDALTPVHIHVGTRSEGLITSIEKIPQSCLEILGCI